MIEQTTGRPGPVSAARDSCMLLARVKPREIDGAKWWPLREVCDALHCSDYRAAARLIDPAHKRMVNIPDAHGRYHGLKVCLVDIKGVERLVIRYGQRTPRGRLMAALDDEIEPKP